MLKINNRLLQKTTGYSYTQIKRWAVAFVEPDPTSGQYSGRARTYNFEEAFRIHCGGYLVSHFKFNLKEASTILTDINLWLKNKGWPISKFINFKKNSFNEIKVIPRNSVLGWHELIFYIYKGFEGDMSYRVKEIFYHKDDSDDNGNPVVIEKYRQHYFSYGEITMASGPSKEISLWQMVLTLAGSLSTVENKNSGVM